MTRLSYGTGRSLGLIVGTLCLVGGLMGCQTARRMPEVDLTEPGWECWEGQAVWQSRRERMPAISGDLRVCLHRTDRALIQFDKPALNVMMYQEREGTWYLEVPPADKRFSGRTPPPRSLVWPELIRHLEGKPPGEGWQVRKTGSDAWLITNVHDKGWLRGYLKRSDLGAKR